MSETAIQMSFDYGVLDAETRIVIQQRTGEIKALMKRTASDIIEIGQKLIEVKTRLEHGQFGGWLETEFEWGERTARRFMGVAESFKTDSVSDLIPPKALYLLSAPSTPETARQEAVERAEAGEPITHAKAREIVEGHRPVKAEPPEHIPDDRGFEHLMEIRHEMLKHLKELQNDRAFVEGLTAPLNNQTYMDAVVSEFEFFLEYDNVFAGAKRAAKYINLRFEELKKTNDLKAMIELDRYGLHWHNKAAECRLRMRRKIGGCLIDTEKSKSDLPPEIDPAMAGVYKAGHLYENIAQFAIG